MTKLVDRKIIFTLFFTMVGASCEIFNAMNALADNPKARRYPTDEEIKKMLPKFHSRVESIEKGGRRGQSTQTQIKDLDAFTKAWAQLNPNVSPFLGSWGSWGDVATIYPSTVKDKVCIFYSGTGTAILDGNGNGVNGNSYVVFRTAKVISNQIHHTSFRSITLRYRNSLGDIFIDSKENIVKVGDIIFSNPKRPPKLSTIIAMQDQSKSSQAKLLREFTQAGCRDSIP